MPPARKSSFDHLQLDTGIAEYTPQRGHDSVQEKGGKMSWLRKPAIFGGSSKRDKTPPRSERGGPQSAGRGESPPHKVDTSPARNRASAPSKGNDLAYRSLAPRDKDDQYVSQESHGVHDYSTHLMSHGKSSRNDSLKLESEVEELKKEVKGLREAFMKLQREHGELRSELRSARLPGQSCGALPIHVLDNKPTSKFDTSDFGLSTSPPSVLDQSSAVHKPESVHTGKQLVPRRPNEGGMLRSILESCGFGEQERDLPALEAPPLSQVEQQDQSDAESSRYEGYHFAGIADVSAPLSLTLESGASKASTWQQADNTQMGSFSLTSPGTSPLGREGPMNTEGRGGKRKSGTGVAGETHGSGSPLSSPTSKVRIEAGKHGLATTTLRQGLSAKGGNPMAPKKPFSIGTLSLPQDGEALPSNFGAMNNAVPHFGSESDRKEKADHSSLHHWFDESSFLSRVHDWKSPQLGEPLELPFPEIHDVHLDGDDDIGSHLNFPFSHHVGESRKGEYNPAVMQYDHKLLSGNAAMPVDKQSHLAPGTIQRHVLSSHHAYDNHIGSLQGHSMPQNSSETFAHSAEHENLF